MTASELIDKYRISLHTDGEKIRIPGGKSLPAAELEQITSRKPEIVEELRRRKAEHDAALAEYKRKLDALSPGIEAIEAAQAAVRDWHRRFNDSFEHGNYGGEGVGAPPPKDAVKLACEQYPREAAYLRAHEWSGAAHFVKAAAGKRAKDRILNGEDYAAALADMEAEWHAYCDKAALD